MKTLAELEKEIKNELKTITRHFYSSMPLLLNNESDKIPCLVVDVNSDAVEVQIKYFSRKGLAKLSAICEELSQYLTSDGLKELFLRGNLAKCLAKKVLAKLEGKEYDKFPCLRHDDIFKNSEFVSLVDVGGLKEQLDNLEENVLYELRQIREQLYELED